jgi:aspartyl-tRNA(Asn)/glutamyl-tRNA(Gln) amidotransferase subunit B
MSEASNYIPTIGIEIHVELKTNSKMFCCSKNDPNEKRPNQNICPVCMAHPGTLPVINKEAVKHVLKVGSAIGAKLADYTEFDRKSYFYPDLPKGYQLSQFAYPLVSGGSLGGVDITRIHLEEDTARSQHDPVTGETLVDYNRAGVPLMELVTEPVVHSAKQAGDFCRELQILMRTLGASEANMEKGEMRVEANISVSRDVSRLGTKCEVKNLNSFKSMERAIEFEIARQIEMLENGEEVVQETRGWDENKQVTFSQRKKEGSADYRYFPDPDLSKLVLSEHPELSGDAIHNSLPELPNQLREKYVVLGIPEKDIEIYLADRELHQFFLEASAGVDAAYIKPIHNYTISDVASLRVGQEIPIKPVDLRLIVNNIIAGNISSRAAKDILKILSTQPGDPMAIAKEKGWIQVSDVAQVKVAVNEVLSQNQKSVDEYKAGKKTSAQFIVGQVMKQMKGAGNPIVIQQVVAEELDRLSTESQ